MAHTFSNLTDFKIDSETGVLISIKEDVNNVDPSSTLAMLDDTGLGTATQSWYPGIAGATIGLNGFINSTTDAIFGPLMGNRTSLTKTVAYKNGVSWYTGEFWPGNVRMPAAPSALVTWSATLTLDGTLTQTSVEPT